MIVEFKLINPRLISVNDQYMHPVRKSKSGRYVSYVCKSPDLKEVQQYYSEVLSESIKDEEVQILRDFINENPKGRGLSLEMHLGMPESQIYEHDISNFIKAVEDCISTRLKIDDKYNLSVYISKYVLSSEDTGKWEMKVKVTPCEVLSVEEIKEARV